MMAQASALAQTAKGMTAAHLVAQEEDLVAQEEDLVALPSEEAEAVQPRRQPQSSVAVPFPCTPSVPV